MAALQAWPIIPRAALPSWYNNDKIVIIRIFMAALQAWPIIPRAALPSWYNNDKIVIIQILMAALWAGPERRKNGTL